jgi:hypothetical protein
LNIPKEFESISFGVLITIKSKGTHQLLDYADDMKVLEDNIDIMQPQKHSLMLVRSLH